MRQTHALATAALLLWACSQSTGSATPPHTPASVPTAARLPLTPSARPSTLTPTAPVPTSFEDQGRTIYIGSRTARIGVDTRWGGAIREIWLGGENLINNFDGGRLMAVSFYDGDQPPASSRPNDTGWNATPSDMYDNANAPLEHSFGNHELYLRSRYIQWFPDDKGGGRGRPIATDIVVETWIAFIGTDDTVRISYRVTNAGDSGHAIAHQEFPFVYVRTPYSQYVTYAGSEPWTGGSETSVVIPARGSGGGSTVSTERWAGFVNPAGEGLILWAPQSYGQFSYSYFDNPGPAENSTLYLLPRAFLAIPPGFSEETQVFLFLGDWRRGRERLQELAAGLEFGDIMPPFGTIDAPSPMQIVSGTITIDGWAIDDRGVASVRIRIDGKAFGEAAYGRVRPDVDAEYPGLPQAPGFGFSLLLDTRTLANGAHLLEGIAEDISGNTSQLRPGAIQLQVQN